MAVRRLPCSLDTWLRLGALGRLVGVCALMACSDQDGTTWQALAEAQQVALTIDNAATVTALLEPLRELNVRQTIQSLADFPTRYHDSDSGQDASVWIRDRWQAYAMGRADVKVALIDHDETPQQSISLTIEGTKYPDELVVLGGHMDSINLKGGAAPGADDNASGIAVLDETIRAAMTLGYRPDRTVVFYAYAAEEIGLVGSDEIAAAAAQRDLNVLGVLQLDMTNYNPSPSPYLAIVTDFTDATLNAFARKLIETYVKLPWKNTDCGYACSDHGSWQKRGFSAHYVHESTVDESNDFIHTDKDTLALSNGSAQHSLYFAQYSVAYMAELAKGAVPPEPECDASKPCPAGSMCVSDACVPAGGAGGAGAGGVGGTSAAGSAGMAGSATAGNGGGGTGGLATAGASAQVPDAQAGTAPALEGTPASTSSEELSCACSTPSRPASPAALGLALLALGTLGLRRRRRRP